MPVKIEHPESTERLEDALSSSMSTIKPDQVKCSADTSKSSEAEIPCSPWNTSVRTDNTEAPHV